MASQTLDSYLWKRYWYERGKSIYLDSLGYPIDPQTTNLFVYNPNLVSFTSLLKTSCLVLLGEPGMGKSHSLHSEFDMLKIEAEAQGNACLWFDLSKFDNGMWLDNSLERDSTFTTWQKGTHDLYLFLEAFDECLLRLDTLIATLIERLKGQETERLFLRIICRSGYWQSAMEVALQTLWKSDQVVKVYELAPLMEQDVHIAAKAEGLEAEGFLRQVREREVVAFATRPVTLKFLLNIYRDKGALPLTRAAIYAQGCYLLCEENRSRQPGFRAKAGITTPQLLAVARRIAAISMFSKPDAFWQEIDLGDVPEHDMTIARLCGGKEVADGNEFEVTEPLVRETIATGLFVPYGSKRVGWAQQTYAEYLAAQYLLTYNVPVAQMLDLITFPGDPERKLIPQLYEVGAWLAGASPDIFRAIRQNDPIVLLQSDVANADVSERAALADVLLQLYDEEKLLEYAHSGRQRYARLRHPELAKQLLQYIEDVSKGDIVRQVAIDIAEACEIHELLPSITIVALDSAQSYDVRVNSAFAVYRIGDDEAKRRLKPLITEQVGDDPNDELKGIALRALWPAHLPANELFSVLTLPKRENFGGMYQSFLYNDPMLHLRPDDVAKGLQWFRTHPHPLPFSLNSLSDGIILAAWENLDVPDVLLELAEVMVAHLVTHENLVSSDRIEVFAQSVFEEDEKRRRVLLTILPLVSKTDQEAFRLLLCRPTFVFPKDVPWLLTVLASEKDETYRRVLIMLITRSFNWDDEAYESILEACEIMPDLREAFSPYCIADLTSDDTEYIREAYYRRERGGQEQRPLVQPPPEERIAIRLREFEAGQLDAWWLLHREMTLEADSEHYASELEADLTSMPGWKNADEPTRQRILKAAKRYVCEAQDDTAQWLGKNVIYHPAFGAYRALRLLLQETPDEIESLPANVWQEWMPILLAYPIQSSLSDNQPKQELIRRAYPHARDKALSTLMALMDQENQTYEQVLCLNDILLCWDEALASALLTKIKEPQLKPEVVGSLLTVLLEHNVSEARDFAYLLLSAPTNKDEGYARAVVAARTLITKAVDTGWATVWQIIENNTELGQEVLSSVAHSYDRRALNIAQYLTDDQLADLFLWLARQYPYVDDPQHDGFFSVSPLDSVRTWRDSIPEMLVNSGRWTACIALRRVAQERPDILWFKRSVLRAEAVFRRMNWSPLNEKDLLTLVRNPQSRVVASGEQLLNAIIESLNRLQTKLQGITPAAQFLWNRVDKFCRPKDENTLSDFVTLHLRDDLERRGIIVNREVEVRRLKDTGIGERNDILVNASLPTTQPDARDTVSVVIEVKGCWHNDLYSALQTQLYDRYLKNTQVDHGLYLVGWYNCTQWDQEDNRWKKANSRSLKTLNRRCSDGEIAIASDGKTIKHYVLNIALPV